MDFYLYFPYVYSTYILLFLVHIDQKQKEILRLSSLIENNDDIACQEQIIKLKSQIKTITEERNKFEAGLEKAFSKLSFVH